MKEGDYMIAYYKLMDLLNRKGLKKVDLQRALDLSPTTMSSLSKNKPVGIALINRICEYLDEYLDCQPGDILEYIKDIKKD